MLKIHPGMLAGMLLASTIDGALYAWHMYTPAFILSIGIISIMFALDNK